MVHIGTPRKPRRPLIVAAFVGALTMAPVGGLGAATLQDAIAFYKQGAFDSAAPILERLANTGDPGASFWLGSMWHQGRGKPVNFRTAHQLYRIAAYHGNADAQNNLGLLYRDGRGVEKNSVVSYAWFSLAAARKNLVAKRNLARLAERMTSARILEGQHLASEYLEWISSPRKAAGSKALRKLSVAPGGVKAGGASIVLASSVPSGASSPPLAIPGREYFIIQLGFFRNAEGIAKLEHTLEQQGFDFARKTVTIRGTSYQRFRVGPFRDPGVANNTARRINRILHIDSAVIPVPS